MNDRTLGVTRKTLGKSLRAPLLEENFTCRALQLAVVRLLGGVGVFLDQKRTWHLGKESGQLSAKLFFFVVVVLLLLLLLFPSPSLKKRQTGENQLTARNPYSSSPGESSWYSAALLETVQRVAVKSCKYCLSGAWEESWAAIYIHCELRPIKSAFLFFSSLFFF